MKKIIVLAISVCFSLISHAQVTKTLTINAGKLSSALTSIEKNTITNLTLTGTIDARDFKTMRDSMNVLAVLDLGGTTIAAYNGTDGTYAFNYSYYLANMVPYNAYMNPHTGIGKISLTSLNLPLSATGIDGLAIAGCTGLTSLTIPPKVLTIAEYAFMNCTGLNSVTIPPLVTSIGKCAFMGCFGLTSIAIPQSIAIIGSDAFISFPGLINVDVNNPNYSSLEGVLFNKNQTTLIQCPTSKTGSFIIPSSVTCIGRGAFKDCYRLTILTIPSSVTSIDSSAFVSCSGLITLTIPSSVSSIGGGAFTYCSSLGSIYAYGVTPVDLSSSSDVFVSVDKTSCILHVPLGSTNLYAAASQWKDFKNIVEIPGFKLSSVKEIIESATGSTTSLDISSNVTWTASSDKTWLTVNPTTGTGTKQTLTFTGQANASTTDQRVAKITISAPDLLPQTITVTQRITIDPARLDAFEPDNSVDKASIIKSGDIQQHSIYPFEDIDYASFDLTNAPAQVEVKFNTISKGHQIQLLAADGTTVLGADNTIINITLTQNGKYYIKAWNPDSLLIPEYQLYLKIKPIVIDRYEPDNTWQEAKLIVPFTEQDDHTIKSIGDVDYLKFTITDAPRTVYVDVTDNRKETLKKFGVWLYGTDGTTLLKYSNFHRFNYGAYLEYTITANGTYFLKIGLPQGESGITRDDYTIKLTTNGVAPTIKCNPNDSLVLVTFYNAMNGPKWSHNQNWLTGKVQNWQGVTLNSVGRVTKLNLTLYGLFGAIPAEIGQLTSLRYLNLGNTKYIELGGNSNLMYNVIPTSMSNLVNLEVLSLDGIRISAVVLPDIFSGMTKLRELYLDGNGFANTELPAGIFNCSKLERLTIDKNNFSRLPDVTGLTNLQSFTAFSNMFTFEDLEPNWTISGFNYSTQHLIGQSKALNPTTGTLVTHTIEVGGTHNLYQWYKNDLPIPGQTTNTLRIENVSKADAGLYHLRVTNSLATQLTLFSETLALYQKELPIYKALESFYNSTGGVNWYSYYKTNWLSEEPLTAWHGIYENESGEYRLERLNCNMIGQLPSNMDELTLFTSIYISNNHQLTGSLPESIGNMDNLLYLDLEVNGLNGEIPSSIGNLKNLKFLSLNDNQFIGSIPATIVNCTNLAGIRLANNNFENMPNLLAMSKLSTVSLARNRFEFDDLMPVNLGNPISYYYSPQQKFGKEEIYNKYTGEALTLTATVGGTGNLYQWYKDGTLLNGKINKTLDFKSIALTDQGSYTCKVNNPDFPDLTLESNAISVFVTKALIANAGTDQSVNELSVVTLDGSGSYNPDGQPLIYKWSAPAGIALSSATIAMPTFTAPDVTVNTSFAISLVVNNGIVDSPANQVIITVKQVNKVPAANAGTDQTVNEGATVILDSSASTDADGNTLTYKWSAQAGITLSSATVAKPTFAAPEVTADKDYTISLVVNDGTVDSPADQVKITVKQVNKVPVANAGMDQTVNEGATVILDSSTSTDADGNTLTYKWSAPAGITLSSATVAKPTFAAPEVTADKDYTISLVVNDGMVDSPADQVKITVKQVNKAPVANAGMDQTVNEGATVILDSSTSTDADGNPLTYKWIAPAGITLSSTTTAKPTFIAPEVTVNTDFIITLVVNDGTVDSSADPVAITVKNVNKVPVANAGTDQSVNELSVGTLDGSTSTDPDGNTLTYKWSAPVGITLNSTTSAKPTFTAPEVTTNTDFTISLVVNDGLVDSPADQVKITVKQVNKVPVANAGTDQPINELSVVTLDGSASTDADGNTLTYIWSAPVGITLNSTTSAKPTFTAPEVTTDKVYTITLVVNDGMADSPADQVTITVKNVNKPPVANAGTDQPINELSVVTLDGSASTDADGNTLTYIWSAPVGITLNSTTSAKPTFTAPEVTANTDFTISLVVNDGLVDSPADQVVILVKNVDHAPSVKSAIQDVSVEKGTADQVIDLKTVFTDSDVTDVLSFAIASNSNNQVVNATIANSALTLNFSTTNTGTADIVITATSNGKVVQSKFKVEVKLVTGIDDLIDGENILVYPNPTNGIVHLKFNNTPKKGTWITVCTISGKVVSKTMADNKEVNLDITGNSPGLYFIKIDQEIPKTFKIVLE